MERRGAVIFSRCIPCVPLGIHLLHIPEATNLHSHGSKNLRSNMCDIYDIQYQHMEFKPSKMIMVFSVLWY